MSARKDYKSREDEIILSPTSSDIKALVSSSKGLTTSEEALQQGRRDEAGRAAEERGSDDVSSRGSLDPKQGRRKKSKSGPGSSRDSSGSRESSDSATGQRRGAKVRGSVPSSGKAKHGSQGFSRNDTHGSPDDRNRLTSHQAAATISEEYINNEMFGAHSASCSCDHVDEDEYRTQKGVPGTVGKDGRPGTSSSMDRLSSSTDSLKGDRDSISKEFGDVLPGCCMDHLPSYPELAPHIAKYLAHTNRHTRRRYRLRNVRTHHMEETAKEYIQRQNIQPLFDMFLKALIDVQPENPVDFLQDIARTTNHLRRIEGAGDKTVPCPCTSTQ